MSSSVLKGISTALLVTVLTLFAGMVWSALGLGGVNISLIVDIGLMASCLVGGFRTGKESGQWLMGGFAGAGYVTVGTLLLALFLPVQGWGFIKVLIEGAIIGLVAGVVGARGTKGVVSGAWQGGRSKMHTSPSYESYDNDDCINYKSGWNQESFQKKVNQPTPNGIGGSNREPQRSRSAKWDFEEDIEEVEWSWGKVEDKKLISSGSGYSESVVVWEPDQVNTDVLEWNKVNVDNASVSKARPWWEE